MVTARTMPHIAFRDVTVRYGRITALDQVSVDIERQNIFAVIGPARSGKSTFLSCINRSLDDSDGARVSGVVALDGVDVFAMTDLHALRRRVGMVAPLPVGLPLSVYDNVAYAPRLAGRTCRAALDELVERCLRQAALWDEVKDRLHQLGTRLSGGQQQRLTLARALSHDPEILCLNKFSIAVDPITTMKIEDVLLELKSEITIVLVTNLVQQARRIADRVAFLHAGRLIEVGAVDTIFSEHPASQLTLDYVQGRFG